MQMLNSCHLLAKTTHISAAIQYQLGVACVRVRDTERERALCVEETEQSPCECECLSVCMCMCVCVYVRDHYLVLKTEYVGVLV